MILAGANVFRINFSHANYEEVKQRIAQVRAIEEELKTHVALLGDLQGPKLRVGEMEENVFVEKPFLPEGQSVAYFRWLYTALTRAKKKVYLINFPYEEIISD